MTENLPFSVHQFVSIFLAHAVNNSLEHDANIQLDYGSIVYCLHWAKDWMLHLVCLTLTVIVSVRNPEPQCHCYWTGRSLLH